jgi:hypothetical protein
MANQSFLKVYCNSTNNLIYVSSFILTAYFITLGYSILVCFKHRKRHEYPISYVWLYLTLTFLIDIASEILDSIGKEFQYLYILFAPVEFYFISTIYYFNTKRIYWKRTIQASFLIYLITCVVYLVILNSNTHYHIFNLRGGLIILMALVYFDELYKKNDYVELQSEPIFWISIGNLFFWAGNFFIVGLVTPLNAIDPNAAELMYLINPALNIFLYIMLAKGLRCYRKVVPS